MDSNSKFVEVSPEYVNVAYSSMPARSYGYAVRIDPGDTFYMNAHGVKDSCGIDIKDIQMATQHVWPNIVCIQKIKRKWWQIWKPKYVAAKFMCVQR